MVNGRKIKRGWHAPAGSDLVHWFLKKGLWYRSLCDRVLIMDLWEQDQLHHTVRRCPACDLELEKREADGLPTTQD